MPPTALDRAFINHADFDPVAAPIHLAYLVAFLAIGAWLADRGLARRLAT
jgi:hypothetical protein